MPGSSNTWNSFSKLDNQSVWDQLRDGNHQALEYLYRTYSKELFNYGMKLYGRKEWVQDTLQELFVDLWRKRQQLSAVTAIKTYLFKAFKYKLQRQYSKEKRWVYQGDCSKLPGLEVELPIENQIIAAQLSNEQTLKLIRAIEKLPTRQREVLHLLFDGEMSYEDVAKIMAINVRSVYTLAWKATSSLRKLLIDFIFLLLFLSPLL